MIQHFIDGELRRSGSGSVFEVINPEDDRVIGECASAGIDDIEAAVEAAERGFTQSRVTSPIIRQHCLLRAAELLKERSEDFQKALIQETGSPITKADREIETSVRLLNSAASATKLATGKTFQSDDPERLSLSVREPVGVVAGFTPFNVPLIKSAKLAGMSFATGNSLVLMPSEQAPTVSVLLAQVFSDAGATAGCFNVVCGLGRNVGDHLTTHVKVKCVSFTGSTAVGDHVAALCGRHRKRVILEMGGQNPLIVLEDADVTAAVQAAIPGAFLYQGQICMASSRMILHEKIAEPFLEALCRFASRLGAGSLLDPQTMIGPIISARSRSRLRALLDDAIHKGAVVIAGGRWEGNRLLPTIVTGVTANMKIHQEEVFGPVAVIQVARDSEHALDLANDNSYGLCASVFTNSVSDALDFSRRLEFGMVHVNEGTILEEADVPFGGIKDSGFGREGIEATVEAMTEQKWVTWKANAGQP